MDFLRQLCKYRNTDSNLYNFHFLDKKIKINFISYIKNAELSKSNIRCSGFLFKSFILIYIYLVVTVYSFRIAQWKY